MSRFHSVNHHCGVAKKMYKKLHVIVCVLLIPTTKPPTNHARLRFISRWIIFSHDFAFTFFFFLSKRMCNIIFLLFNAEVSISAPCFYFSKLFVVVIGSVFFPSSEKNLHLLSLPLWHGMAWRGTILPLLMWDWVASVASRGEKRDIIQIYTFHMQMKGDKRRRMTCKFMCVCVCICVFEREEGIPDGRKLDTIKTFCLSLFFSVLVFQFFPSPIFHFALIVIL